MHLTDKSFFLINQEPQYSHVWLCCVTDFYEKQCVFFPASLFSHPTVKMKEVMQIKKKKKKAPEKEEGSLLTSRPQSSNK